MNARNFMLPFAFLSLIAFAGCSTLQGGKTVLKYEEDSPVPLVTEAVGGGSYALYSGNSLQPKVVVSLESGQTLGFRRAEGGQLLAVAGEDQEIPIDASETHYWKRK